MDLISLADFNAVAAHGGFGPAGRALDRPKATLSRRVAELEESLGVRLIERGSRRLRLTEEGLALYERTRGLIAEIQEAGEAIASNAPVARGRLRISAPVVFAHVVLSRIAVRFALAWPQVELEVIAEDRAVDPVDEGYDLVIRIDPPRDEPLAGRRILGDQRLLVAAPSLAMPATAPGADSWAVPAVMYAASAPGTVWEVRAEDGRTRTIKPMPVLRLSSLLMAHAAVLEGVGAAVLPRLLVDRDIAEGRLVCWGTVGAPVEIWALYHSRRLLSAKVRAFMNVLRDLQQDEG